MNTRTLPSTALILARTAIVPLLAVMAMVVSLLGPPPAQAADTPLPPADGLTEATAAASCWEITQNDPDSQDGVYWLLTPAMTQAEQFYCDQSRAGGGWVLVGRGREDWAIAVNGSGSPAQVRETVDGPGAFAPRQLPGEMIDALHNDADISTLDDGVRLVRATNQAGTTYQEVTFHFESPRQEWTWMFNDEQRVGSYTIDGTTRSGGRTSNFGFNNDFGRVRTITGATEGWMMGFGYGSSVRGNPSSTSHLWSRDTSTGYARPFTQVFIRPKLMSADVWEEIPDSGTAALTGEAVVDSFALPQVWGVAGLGAGPASIEGSNEVSAFAEVQGSVFVGGNFTRIQRTSNAAGAVQQSYLAAFDRDSGELITGFGPTFDNQIKALAAMPGGRIAVGGYFSQVNGQPHPGLVVLDAATGQIDQAFTGQLINYLSGGVPIVRALDVQDGWLYVGGTFTHGTGGSATQEVYARAGIRFSVADGTPDISWNPEFNGTVISLDASEQGDRAYFAGYFSQSRGRDADKAAALSTQSIDLFPWQVHFSNRIGGRAGYQQAVLEVGDRVWLGGSEHSLISYSREDFELLSSSIGQVGGDFQALATDGTVVYGGCHCFDSQYEGALYWPNVGTDWTEAHHIYGTGAWSAATGERIPSFAGSFYTRGGAGAWATFVDSSGVLWQGGDYTYSVRENYVRQWSGGFVRHGQRDTVAPNTPARATAVGNADGVEVSWAASTDDRAVTGYQVLRHDRVVATVTGSSVQLSGAPVDTNYFVRAIDARGNASASTPAFTASSASEVPEQTTLVAAGSSWSYLYDGTSPGENWTGTDFDDSEWATGEAPLGWGHSNLGTELDTTVSPRPLVSFHRHSFEVEDATVIESVELTTRADDGIAVHVNGTEVARQHLDDGPIGPNTYSNTPVNASQALANPVTITIPGHLITTGTNVITASVHSNWRSTPSHSFELEATATIGTQPPAPEPDPDPEPEPEPGTLVTAGSSWSYLYDGTSPGENWTGTDFDDSEWATGEAPLGWGHSNLGTELDTTVSPRPLVSFHRHSFEVEDATVIESVELTTRADDGIAVHVNGTEVARQHLDDGPIGPNTYSNTPVNASQALANPVTITIPGHLITTGTNVITASVHSNWRSTPSHSFELEATATIGTQPPAPEPDPDPEPEPEPAPQAATQPEAAAGPEPAPEAEPRSETETASEPESASKADPEPRPGLEAEPVPESVGPMVIDEEASWSYQFGGPAIPEDWTYEGFDDSEWETGSGVFGWGHASIDTPLDTSQNPRPIASYYRHAFSLEDVGPDGLILTTRADDGVIVYVNGTEVARENLDKGSVSGDTLANRAISADTMAENPLVIEVPTALLNAEENLIAVEVHSSDRSTPSHSFTLIAEEA